MEVRKEINKRYYEKNKEKLREKARENGSSVIKKTPQELGIPRFLEPYIKIHKCSWSMSVTPDIISLIKICLVIGENLEEIKALKEKLENVSKEEIVTE